MTWLTALILGIIQGLTEFLPVSSSGHLELGKRLMSIPESNITFTIVVHGATVLSTLIVFRKRIMELLRGVLKFEWNDEMKYFVKIVISMIPAALIGYFLEEEIDALFVGNLFLVGSMLLFTALLLSFTYYSKPKERKLNNIDAIIIGIAQMLAILPGISRSGATIATGLLLGNKKEGAAEFSFLMVIPLIIGANAKKILGGDISLDSAGNIQLLVGFISAFLVGLMACTWMINIVKKGKLIWFAIYCSIVGSIAITISFI